MKKLLLITTMFLFGCGERKLYTVKVTFCDSRKPIYVEYEGIDIQGPPSTRDIQTYKRAVPEWGGYINVCEIETISEKPYSNK